MSTIAGGLGTAASLGLLHPIRVAQRVAGIRVLRDPYSAKPYVLFYTTKRVGGGAQDFDAIKLLKFGTS